MAKRLSYEQAKDKEYVELTFKDFIKAVRANDHSEAEDCYNEITGVLCAMQERMTSNGQP